MDQNIIHNGHQQQLLEDASGWTAWQFKVKVLLRAADLYEVVDGSSACPESEKAEVISKWKSKDAKAQGIIVTRLSESIIPHVATCNTSKDIWDKLHNIYEQKGDLSVHILQQQFFDMKFREGESMSQYLSRFEVLLCRLKGLGAEGSAQMAITKITSSLPSQYRHFISAWESVPADNRTMEQLVSRLLIEEQRYSAQSQEQARTDTAFAMKSSRKCFNCGKPGHYKKDCKLNKSKNKFCNQCKKQNHDSKDCWFKNKKNESKGNAFPVSVLSSALQSSVGGDWVMDSGATEHMSYDINLFSDYTSLQSPKSIIVGDGKIIQALGRGKITLEAHNGQEWLETTLNEVLYVPELKMNLFSASCATDKGYNVTINQQNCIFKKCDKEEVSALAYRKNNLFFMKFRPGSVNSACVGSSNESLSDWHQKMCHQNIEQVKSVLTKFKVQCDVKNENEVICQSCLQGKSHKKPFPLSKDRAQKAGQVLHMDLCGPMETSSLGGARYYLLIKDDFTKFRTVYFLKNKSETVGKVKSLLNYVIKNLELKVEVIRSDCGLEFTNKEMKSFLESLGIVHQTSVPYTPQQNGCIEREMRTVTEAARTILLASGLGKSLWAEAVNTAVFVLNRTGKSRVKNVTPYELWLKKEPYNIHNLKIFGTKVGVHVPEQKRQKWDSKAEMGYFVGYGETTKGSRVYFPKQKDVFVKREVTFLQGIFCDKEVGQVEKRLIDQCLFPEITINSPENEQPVFTADKTVQVVDHEGDSLYEEENTVQSPEPEGAEEVYMDGILSPQEKATEPQGKGESRESSMSEEWLDSTSDLSETTVVEAPNVPPQPSQLRSGRNTKKPLWMGDYETGYISIDAEPMTLEEAMQSEYEEEWKKAIQVELNTLKENNTWSEVSSVPEGNKVISSKWVFKVKEVGSDKVYKARLVARGFEQSDCDLEVYSPVARLPTFRVFMSIANKLQLPVHQMDVVGAFLHGDIDEIVYLKLPCGKICKLNKSLYGLKKSPKYWNMKFNNFMLSEGFIKSQNDHCLYFKKDNDYKMYVLLFVDDILMFSSDKIALIKFKVQLCKSFKMKDLGLAKSYLGIDIQQSVGKTVISQGKYLSKVLEIYNMSNCKSAPTPIDQNFKFELLQNEKSESSEIEKQCRQLVGSLMYAVCGTRPDLCVSVGFLSRYQHCASVMLFKALKRVLRYIKGTLNYALVYNSTDTGLQGFVDSDWAGDTKDRKSTSGYLFNLNNCIVIWCCKKQLSVSLSSTESEYIALSMAIQEACWLQYLLNDFDIVINQTVIFEDNQSVIKLAFNSENNKRLKHLETRYHFIVEKIKDKCISLKYIKTQDNFADLLTKPLGTSMFQRFVQSIFSL
jgi:hypothetical protein